MWRAVTPDDRWEQALLRMERSGRTAKPAADMIVMSRLLVLQSKRILLTSLERRQGDRSRADWKTDLNRLQGEVQHAHDRYLDAVIEWGSPDSAQFWLVAYGTMIDGAEGLWTRLNDVLDELPPEDRAEVRIDLAQLRVIIERWRSTMRTTMNGEDVA